MPHFSGHGCALYAEKIFTAIPKSKDEKEIFACPSSSIKISPPIPFWARKKYSSFDLSFDVKNIHYNLNRDSDPTIAVCLNDDNSEKTIFILFGFAFSRIRVIASSN